MVRLCSALEETLLTKQLSFAAYFILRGHGSHIDFRFDNQPLFVISPIKSIPFLNFSRDHLRSILGIIYGLGIICGTVLLFIGAPLTAIFTI